MNELLNRRHLFLETKSWHELPLIIEKVDNYITHSLGLEFSSDAVVVYGGLGEELLRVGREVVGYDNKLVHHEELRVVDLPRVLVESRELNFENYDALGEVLLEGQSHFGMNFFRLQIYNYEKVVISFMNDPSQ